jgi:uncharacterized protein (DUF1499 family)
MRFLGGLIQLGVFAVLIFASLLIAGIIANRLPLTDPPGLGARVSTYLTTNVAETSDDSSFDELRQRRYEAPPELLFDVARRAVQNLKWEIVSLDASKKEIQAIVTTKVWRFKDDVTIHIRPGQPSGNVLWMRSASRVGKGDLGANTRHVIDLVDAVNGIVPAQAIITPKSEG